MKKKILSDKYQMLNNIEAQSFNDPDMGYLKSEIRDLNLFGV